MKEKSSNNMRQ